MTAANTGSFFLFVKKSHLCVFITAVPITKLFAWGDGTREEPGTLT